MAKYTVRGIALNNRCKTMHEALAYARTDDDVIWNGLEKDAGLNIKYPLRIIGNKARLKVPEHAVGLTIEGDGDLLLENLYISCKQISNGINIPSWLGTITLNNIRSDYNTRKRDKVYPTVIGDNLNSQNTQIVIKQSDITRLTIAQAQSIISSDSAFSEETIMQAENVSANHDKFNNNTTIYANNYTLDNSEFDNLVLSGEGNIHNIIINKSIKIDGNVNIDNLTLVNNANIILENGTFTLKNCNFASSKVITNEAELVIQENVQLQNHQSDKKTIIANKTSENGTSQALEELNSLIGLDNVKSSVQRFISTARITAARQKQGLDTADLSLNLIYSGAPGTGKTTVAKIMGRLMFEQGIISQNKFIHVGRSDLIGQYVGETAGKVMQQMDKAMGGILFIDEAYSLLNSDDTGNDFGTEAVDTLTDETEKRHNDLVVILAGYTEDMKQFFNRANPGLKSRFSTWIEFPDYSLDELFQIATLKLQKQYILSNEVAKYLYQALANFKQANLVEGNGRFVRNFIQEIVFAQAERLNTQSNLNKDALMTLVPSDIQNAYQNFGKQLINRQ